LVSRALILVSLALEVVSWALSKPQKLKPAWQEGEGDSKNRQSKRTAQKNQSHRN
jgi:hypothetical protein